VTESATDIVPAASHPRPADPDRPARRAAVPPGRSAGAALVGLIDAAADWLRAPRAAERRRLSTRLAAYGIPQGIAGARVVLRPPLPDGELGVGTLRRTPSSQRTPGLERRELRTSDGEDVVGELLVDGPSDAATTLGRVLELASTRALALARAREARDALAALDEATRAIAGVLSVERVLQVIVDNVRVLVGARYAALGVLDDQRQIDPFITSGLSRAQRERIGPPPHGRGLLGLIIEEGRAVRVPEIAAHPRSVGFPANHPPMHALLGVPVATRGRILGNLYVTDKEDGSPFTDADQRLVELFAAHAGIAMQNARLHEQEQRIAILEERQRIGRDLHDGVIQSIYAVGLMLDDALELAPEDPAEASARIEHAIESINLTIRDIRNFIFGLRPEPLDQAGLVEALAAMAEEFRVNTMIDIALEVTGPADFELPAEDTAQLLQLAREALSNVARHARAGHAEIHLLADERALELAIVDDGVGFDPAARRGPGHMGLGNMRTRATELGGELLVESAVGRGSRVAVRVPRNGDSSDGASAGAA
jgi:two-component system, NarL family, sensor histidine kinase DevS